MTELTFEGALPGSELRSRLRSRLDELRPGLHLIAEDVLGAESRIDLVTLDPAGRTTLVLIAEPDRELERVADALADRDWLAPRLADWRQLAPQLALRPEAGVSALVVGTRFGARERALARVAGKGVCELVVARAVRNGSAAGVMLESLGDEVRDPAVPNITRVRSRFRSGLDDSEIRLSTRERHAFER